MEKIIGMRIRECRVKKRMPQEEMAEAFITKKPTVSTYENDKIDIKIRVFKDLAKVLYTNVSYLVDGDENDIAPEIMQGVLMLQEIQNKEFRKAAIEQMKILVELNDTKIQYFLYQVDFFHYSRII